MTRIPITPLATPRTSTAQQLPAEWAPQSGVMLTWPHADSDWAPRLAQVEPVFVALARAISRREKVLIACCDAAHREGVRARLAAEPGMVLDNVALHVAPSNDTWARDHGPITVLTDAGPRLLDFRFNGWGAKYAHDLDDEITARLHAAGAFGRAPLERVDLILEGGSLEVDGEGTLLTTRRCLLSPARNPKLNQSEIEAELKARLGVTRVLWLAHGYLAGDDTDSHIDTLARLCDPRTIAYVACTDPGDEHYAELKLMEAELEDLRTADGRPYRLVPLPWPRARLDEDGERMPATYANFLVINGAVLVPTYDDPADDKAIAAIAGCFPGREVVGVPCLPLIYQHGSLHCVTMQLPEGVLP